MADPQSENPASLSQVDGLSTSSGSEPSSDHEASLDLAATPDLTDNSASVASVAIALTDQQSTSLEQTETASPVTDSSTCSTNNAENQADQFELAIRRYPLIWFFIAWIIGVCLAQPLEQHWKMVAAIAVILGVTALVLACQTRFGFSVKAVAGFCAVVPVACVYSLAHRPPESDCLTSIAGRQSDPIALRGVIQQAAVWSPNPYHRESDPNSDPWSTRWRVHWEQLRDVDNWIDVSAVSTLTTKGRIHQFLPGDKIEVFGSIEAIAQPSNPGMPNFAELAKSKGMFVTINTDDSSQIHKLETTFKFPLQRMRGFAVRAIDQALHRHIIWGQAELAAALVFGQREQVDWESQQQLMATGTLHMLAISGMHVEIIAVTLLILSQLLALRRGTVATLVIGVCVAYSGLAGSNPPVLRALILIVAVTAARYWGMNPRLFNLLALSAVVLSLQSTSNLTNVGVQLSFLAVATIGVFNRDGKTERRNALQSLLEESLPMWRRCLLVVGRYAASGLRISFWVGLFTTPLIWHHFHVVSLVSIPLNVVLSIPLMIGLLCGLATGLVAWIPWVGGVIGSVLGAISGSCLAVIQGCVELAYQVPLGHLWLPSPPLWWSSVFYGLIAVWLAFARNRYRAGLGTALVIWLAVGIALFASGPRGFLGNPDSRDMHSVNSTEAQLRELRCTFIDVGHGTSAIIELPDGRVWLYDAGHMGVPDRSHEVIANALWSLPTARIDTLILSHADSDHYNATTGLLRRFRLGRVVSTARFWDSQAREVKQVRESLFLAGISREIWNASTELPQASTTETSAGSPPGNLPVLFSVLHPKPLFRGETDNADSLCLQLEYAGSRLLLPGDIEGSGMLALCEQPPRDCAVMMAPHHGSLAFDAAPLLEWCRPKTVIISGNHRAARPEVIGRYALADQLGITFLHGAIQVSLRSDGSIATRHWTVDHWEFLP